MSDDPRQLPRRALIGGLASAGALGLAGCSGGDPPTYGSLLRAGDNLTWRAQRLLLPRAGLVREYDRSEITSIAAIGTTNPANPKEPGFDADQAETYDRLLKGGFADWRLSVEGAVARPATYSLAELRRLPARTQVTKHTCEEGWSAIAEWTGPQLGLLLKASGVRPSARFVNLYAYDVLVETIDLVDAFHPQTILAYAMNGRDLPRQHGAPLRVRVETQLGYKSLKYLRRIVVTDRFEDPGKRGDIQNGWSWYAGI
jgi:DMSO/TMAO reductase YedYZ molybdopterin-dependent catalytic subunit